MFTYGWGMFTGLDWTKAELGGYVVASKRLPVTYLSLV